MNTLKKNKKFDLIEIKIILSLSSIFFLRMFGMFVLLPVLNNHPLLINANKLIVGIAIGVYGLFQSIFQFPFGLISDYIGRKSIILIGLTLLAIGSIITLQAESITFFIIGRAIQGSGAITSASMALIGDTIKEHKLSKAMFIVGIVFSLSFALSIIISPVIVDNFGLNFIFLMIFYLSLISILIAYFFLPSINKKNQEINLNLLKENFLVVIKNKKLLKINLYVMCLHITLMSNFFTLPYLFEQLGFILKDHWKIYFFIILIAFIFIVFVNKQLKRNIFYKKNIFLIYTNIMFISSIILIINSILSDIAFLMLGLQIYFISFCIIEALLPSFVNKLFNTENRGAAMGIYSSIQFLGIASGGVIGGFLCSININYVFIFSLLLSLFLIVLSFKIKNNN